MDFLDFLDKLKPYLLQLAITNGGPFIKTQEQICQLFDLDRRSPFLKMALYEASVDSARDYDVLLSALVINSVTGLPDMSFYCLADEVGRDTRDRTYCWLRELKKIKDCYQPHPEVQKDICIPGFLGPTVRI